MDYSCEVLTGARQEGYQRNSEAPKNEKRLQEICDAIVNAHQDSLVREYPFLRWASALTKADWSVDRSSLWVELKYPRNGNLLQITDAIAADITKYGDNNCRVLFVIYDPHRVIVNELEFASTVRSDPGMDIRFIR